MDKTCEKCKKCRKTVENMQKNGPPQARKRRKIDLGMRLGRNLGRKLGQNVQKMQKMQKNHLKNAEKWST